MDEGEELRFGKHSDGGSLRPPLQLLHIQKELPERYGMRTVCTIFPVCTYVCAVRVHVCVYVHSRIGSSVGYMCVYVHSRIGISVGYMCVYVHSRIGILVGYMCVYVRT